MTISSPMNIHLGVVLLAGACGCFWLAKRRRPLRDWAALGIGWFLVAVATFVGVSVFIVFPVAEGCYSNVSQLGQMLRVYAGEHDGHLPPLSRKPGNLMFDYTGDIVEYLTEPRILACPWPWQRDHPVRSGQEIVSSYWYLPYKVRDLAELQQLGHHLTTVWWRQGDEAAENPPAVMPERLDVDAAQEEAAKQPILIEKPEHHLSFGVHVLYLDGHVELLHVNDKWPVTEEAMSLLCSLGK